MPFIHIKSLPFEEQLDVASIIINIARDFSKETGIDLEHIHTTWEFYQAGHYAKGDKTKNFQPKQNYPIIVDLLTPDFNEIRSVSVMLRSIAESISRQLDFSTNNIFINHRQAHSAMVYDEGEIIQW